MTSDQISRLHIPALSSSEFFPPFHDTTLRADYEKMWYLMWHHLQGGIFLFTRLLTCEV